MRGLAAVVVTLALAPWSEAQVTDLERQRLVAHLQMTAAWLEDELAGLSPSQLAFRPAANVWSILEVLDHIVVVQPIYWRDLQRATPVSAGRAGTMSDADVLWYGIDRTNRETALATEAPSRKVRDLPGALREYRQHHAQLLDYSRRTRGFRGDSVLSG